MCEFDESRIRVERKVLGWRTIEKKKFIERMRKRGRDGLRGRKCREGN